MQAWKDYQEKNKDRFLNEMLDLLRIPSVSAKSEHKADMQKCAEAVKKSLLDAGCDKAECDATPMDIPLFMAKKSLIHPNQRCWYMDIMMCSRPNHWNSGIAALLNP